MKTLFVLFALTFSINAFAEIEVVNLRCTAEGSSRSSHTTLTRHTDVKRGANPHTSFTVTKTTTIAGHPPHTEVVHLYVAKTQKNMIFETVYTGTAEQQVQVDTFVQWPFMAIVPDVLENGVKVTYYNSKNEVTNEMRFVDCKEE